jgi:hypothetical protein
MMTRRKSEITRGGLNRKWPHHVEVPAEKVQDPADRAVIFCAVVVASRAFSVVCFLHTTVHDSRLSGARKFGTEIFPPTIVRRFMSGLLGVRVLVVLGRITTVAPSVAEPCVINPTETQRFLSGNWSRSPVSVHCLFLACRHGWLGKTNQSVP